MEHLNDFTSNERLQKLLDDIKPARLDFIIHFTPSSVFGTKQYQDFMEQIDAKRHSIQNETYE